MTYLDKIKKLCKEQKKTVKSLEEYCGLSKGIAYKWNVSTPGVDTINKCAEFFNVPSTYFTGEAEVPILDVKNILEQLIAQLGSDAQVNFSAADMPDDEKAFLNQGLQNALDKFQLYKKLKEDWQDENQ